MKRKLNFSFAFRSFIRTFVDHNEQGHVSCETQMRITFPFILLLAVGCILALPSSAQSLIRRADSLLTKMYNMGNVDTANVTRPETKWTIAVRVKESGTTIRTEGIDEGKHFESEMDATRKATLSVCVSYLGLSLSAALNPAKLLGRYHDYELNLNSYGRRFGFDLIYQDAKNFKGWYDQDGLERMQLEDGMLSVKTLNLNAFYVLNNRRFAYPAAFSQSYIQRRSAGGFLLAASAMGQRVVFGKEQQLRLNMTNAAVGAGYGYNYVPSRGWLLHISALPTFIVYSHTSMSYGDDNVSLRYHFPEVIVTSRGAVVHYWGNMFLGMSMLFNFTNVGHEENLAVHNIKWHVCTSFGLRLGKR